MVIGVKTTDNTGKREKLPDILRGFAIIMVVLGHCIQEGSGEIFKAQTLFFSDKIYQFIYSFHMPLFMMVSGYLSYTSITRAVSKKEILSLLKRRSSALLIPVFMWTALDYIRILVTNHINGLPQPEAVIFVYFYNALNNLWFLWAVFWCFLIVCFVHFIFKDSIVVYLIGFIGLFFIPDGLGLGAYKYMMPFFIAAFYAHDFIDEKIINSLGKIKAWHVAANGVIFIGLFVFFDENSLIYLTGYKLIGKNIPVQLGIDLYRMLIGFAGGMFFVLLWQLLINIYSENKNVLFELLECLGAKSMGIYIVSGYILIFVVNRMTFINEHSYLLNILECIIVLAVSYLVTAILERIPMLCRLVGRGRKK